MKKILFIAITIMATALCAMEAVQESQLWSLQAELNNNAELKEFKVCTQGLNARNSYNLLLINKVIQLRAYDILADLCAQGVNVNEKDQHGTPLEYGVQGMFDSKSVGILLKYKAHVPYDLIRSAQRSLDILSEETEPIECIEQRKIVRLLQKSYKQQQVGNTNKKRRLI